MAFYRGDDFDVLSFSFLDGTRRIYPKDDAAVSGDRDVAAEDGDGVLLLDGDDLVAGDGDDLTADETVPNDGTVQPEGDVVQPEGEAVMPESDTVLLEDDVIGPDADTSSCIPNETRQIPCGLNGNGLQSQICVGGDWQNQGVCVDDDVCVNGDSQHTPCGLNGRGVQSQDCVDGQWVDDGLCNDPDECVDGETREIPCGTNDAGTQEQECVLGQWENIGSCVMPPQTGRWTCVSKVCKPVYGDPACGDGTCSPKNGESAKSCPVDCDKTAINGKDQNCSDIYDCAFYGWFESTPGYWTCSGIGQKKCTVNKSTTYCNKTGYDYCYAGTAGFETATTCAPDCDNKMLNQNSQTGCSSAVDCIFLDWP